MRVSASASRPTPAGPLGDAVRRAAALIAKYYSWERSGEGGSIKRIGLEKALVNMLTWRSGTPRTASTWRGRAGRARPVGAVLRGGARAPRRDLDAKLTALAYLWQATSQARVLALLAGAAPARLARRAARPAPRIEIPRRPAPRADAGR